MGLTLQELLKLSERTTGALGWNPGQPAFDISIGNEEADDIQLYYDIHPTILRGDLLQGFNDIYEKIQFWNKYACKIEIWPHDDPDEFCDYYLMVQLKEINETD